MGTTTFPVEHTWDGRPIDRAATLTARRAAGVLEITVDAIYRGDPPPPGPAGPTWGLWDYEVVELFVLGPGERYTEIELGPHGHHLVLRLEGRRSAVARELPLDFEATISGGRWRGRARLDAALLPPGPHRANAYAIYGVGAARRYLAWAPAPGPAPDFHRLESFRSVTM